MAKQNIFIDTKVFSKLNNYLNQSGAIYMGNEYFSDQYNNANLSTRRIFLTPFSNKQRFYIDYLTILNRTANGQLIQIFQSFDNLAAPLPSGPYVVNIPAGGLYSDLKDIIVGGIALTLNAPLAADEVHIECNYFELVIP